MYYAHSKNLTEHLQNVAKDASAFVKLLGAESLARASGLLHDAGKYAPTFQIYLLDVR